MKIVRPSLSSKKTSSRRTATTLESPRKTPLPLLQSVYDRLPRMVGTKVKFAKITPDERADRVRRCIDQLSQARIVREVFHSHADGIPLAAQVDDKVFKTYWLDIGLLNHMLGVTRPFVASDEELFHAGVLAEQFIAQHLAGLGGAMHAGALFYWLREGRRNSEVDFVVQHAAELLPSKSKAARPDR